MIVLISYFSSLDSCGISTHTEIGFRAIEFLGSSDDEDVVFIRSELMTNLIYCGINKSSAGFGLGLQGVDTEHVLWTQIPWWYL